MLFIAIATIIVLVLFANIDSDAESLPQKGDNMNVPVGFYRCDNKELLEAFIRHARKMNDAAEAALAVHRENKGGRFIELCIEAVLFDGKMALMAAEKLGLLSIVCKEVTLKEYSLAEERMNKVLSSHDCPLKAFHALNDPGCVEFTDERYKEVTKSYDNTSMTVRSLVKERHAAAKSVIEDFDTNFERVSSEINSQYVS